jgi:hypothetical protein
LTNQVRPCPSLHRTRAHRECKHVRAASGWACVNPLTAALGLANANIALYARAYIYRSGGRSRTPGSAPTTACGGPRPSSLLLPPSLAPHLGALPALSQSLSLVASCGRHPLRVAPPPARPRRAPLQLAGLQRARPLGPRRARAVRVRDARHARPDKERETVHPRFTVSTFGLRSVLFLVFRGLVSSWFRIVAFEVWFHAAETQTVARIRLNCFI